MDQEWDKAIATHEVTVAVLNQGSSIVMDEETVTRTTAVDLQY